MLKAHHPENCRKARIWTLYFLVPQVRGHWDHRIRDNILEPLSKTALAPFLGIFSWPEGLLQILILSSVMKFLLDEIKSISSDEHPRLFVVWPQFSFQCFSLTDSAENVMDGQTAGGSGTLYWHNPLHQLRENGILCSCWSFPLKCVFQCLYLCLLVIFKI